MLVFSRGRSPPSRLVLMEFSLSTAMTCGAMQASIPDEGWRCAGVPKATEEKKVYDSPLNGAIEGNGRPEKTPWNIVHSMGARQEKANCAINQAILGSSAMTVQRSQRDQNTDEHPHSGRFRNTGQNFFAWSCVVTPPVNNSGAEGGGR